MIKKCIQKPYTVFVGVIIALVLGFVCLTKMSTDLLPDMTIPYLMVITTNPGASPEKIERDVTQPLETALGTISGVENVQSISAENYSMVILEFADDADISSATVKVNSALEQVKSILPENSGTPNIMELSLDMVASLYTSVSRDGYDIYEISEFVQESIVPEFERLDGVASITTLGLIEKSVEVRLNQDKIDDINAQVLGLAEDKLDDAKKEITDARKDLKKGQSELKSGKKKLEKQQNKTTKGLADAQVAIDKAVASKAAYESQVVALQTQKTSLEMEKKAYTDNQIPAMYDTLDATFAGLSAMQPMLDLDNAAAKAAGDTSLDGVTIPAGIKDAVKDKDNFEKAKAWLIKTAQAAGQDTSDLDKLNYDEIKKVYDIVITRIPQIDTELANLETEIKGTQAMVDQVTTQMAGLEDQYKELLKGSMSAAAGFGSADAQIAAANSAIDSAKEELKKAEEKFEDSMDEVKDNANIDQLVSLETLSGLLYAQNFEMPAGYVDDENDNQWLLKVGDSFTQVDQLENLVLCKLDDIGDITLGDVADITVIDNSSDVYEKVNGEQAVVMAIMKSSTASTSEVSKACGEKMRQLEEEYEGLHLTNLMDQGEYIFMFIEAVLKSMLLGALLAVVVLIVFLKDPRPTIVVAFSIPFSVLVALILLYFSGISINMMSLSGLSLGIGMLVDNSIVTIENIYRLRNRNMAAPRAALQGTRQIAGPIIASTLTTVCVFVPILFTTGLVRQMMLPFALAITFSLTASLVVALLVVPVIGVVLLRRSRPVKHPLFDVFCNIYAKILSFCLKVKLVPLALALALLGLSIFQMTRTGISILPNMVSQEIMISVVTPEEYDQEQSYKLADEVMERIMKVEHVGTVGSLTNTASLIMSAASGMMDYHTYTMYVMPEEGIERVADLKKISKDIEAATADIDAEISSSDSSMSEMGDFMSDNITINLKGRETDKLLKLSEDIMAMLESVEGCKDISNGQEEGDNQLYLNINKSKAMEDGLTVAQIFQTLNGRITTEKKALTEYLDETEMAVNIIDDSDALTLENILDTTFEVTVTNDDGEQETEEHKLEEYATLEKGKTVASISRENGARVMSVTARMEEGYNSTLVGREVQERLDAMTFDKGYTAEMGGSTENVADMLSQMLQMLALGFVLIYLIMVAQFQSLKSPFIIIFTVPLAFTGGFLGLTLAGQQLTILSLLGFAVLMGTIVNNGIVFVDFTNQLRLGGMERRDALVAAGRTRMRPILMTAMTTILAMCPMAFSGNAGDAMGKDMAIVVIGGMAYATLMTLFVVPVVYDLLFKRNPKVVDVGDDTLDDVPDDAAEFMAELAKKERG